MICLILNTRIRMTIWQLHPAFPTSTLSLSLYFLSPKIWWISTCCYLNTYELWQCTNMDKRRHELWNNLDNSRENFHKNFILCCRSNSKLWRFVWCGIFNNFSNFDRIILCTNIITNFHYYVIENAKYWHWNYFTRKVFKVFSKFYFVFW